VGESQRKTEDQYSYPLHSNHCFPRTVVAFTFPRR
jgi:hypothetical protein